MKRVTSYTLSILWCRILSLDSSSRWQFKTYRPYGTASEQPRNSLSVLNLKLIDDFGCCIPRSSLCRVSELTKCSVWTILTILGVDKLGLSSLDWHWGTWSPPFFQQKFRTTPEVIRSNKSGAFHLLAPRSLFCSIISIQAHINQWEYSIRDID